MSGSLRQKGEIGLASFLVGSKAETLDSLRPLLRMSRIGDQVRFTVREWREAPEIVLDQIRRKFGDVSLAIRSSALIEDIWGCATAGRFHTELCVPGDVPHRIRDAIQAVIDSYTPPAEHDQVFVQAMVKNVLASGVVLTRSLDLGAPYYVLNLDQVTHDTASVTSGQGERLRTLVVHRKYLDIGVNIDLWALKLLQASWEIEDVVGKDSLDIELALSAEGLVHILQVRQISMNPSCRGPSDQGVFDAIQSAVRVFQQRSVATPGVLGNGPCFGVMPDWNPAEIIGTQPRPLAFSLYRYLVTDTVWATQRAEYGYRDLRPQPLVVSFAGRPYVDVRLSLNSFIPSALSDQLAGKLVQHYLDRLRQHPELHDKIEFDIAFTCLCFDFDQKTAARLWPSGFSDEDIRALRAALYQINQAAIKRLDADLSSIASLDRTIQEIVASQVPAIQQAFLLLDCCKRFGTLPFAHAARAAFLTEAVLRSAVATGVIDIDDKERFYGSLDTVTRRMETDGMQVAAGLLNWEDYVARYGHLRPDTYEITSAAYEDNPEGYLRPCVSRSRSRARIDTSSVWSPKARRRLETLLPNLSLDGGIAAADRFFRRAIEGRELLKFAFTKLVHLAFRALKSFASSYGLEAYHLSYISIEDLARLRSASAIRDTDRWLVHLYQEGKQSHELTCAVQLPALLFETRDFWVFERLSSEPNFVGRLRVTGEVVRLAGGQPSSSLRRKIVLLPRADPGYDWIFGHDISGLITMYGGANSHMAIRAAELGFPAALGVGESAYNDLRLARVIELDCAARKVRRVL